MTVDRRYLLAAGLGATAAAATAAAGPRTSANASESETAASGRNTGLVPGAPADQSRLLQALIDESANRGAPLHLPPGRIRARHIRLRSGTRIIGAAGTSVLEFSGGPAFLGAKDARDIVLEGLVLDGAMLALDPVQADGLLHLAGCSGMRLSAVTFQRGLLNGLSMHRCAGSISDCSFEDVSQAAIRSLDATGLEILHNRIAQCGNNGIQIWREGAGEDGTLVAMNRIEGISARGGGTGENGNGISVFRAGSVLVANNRISDCAYSAIRGNAASNIQMTANSTARSGEVALYAEFGFEGAVISANVIDGAASGIEVTNFNEGGRLAIVQGNLIRRLRRREHEAVDKRGDGIGVEADSIVSGNVIEDAENAGIVAGWGRYMRNCQITQNLVRKARFGILLTSSPDAGACLVTTNMLSEISGGAIRMMDHGKVTGPDLAQEAPATSRLSITGNLVA